MLLDEFEFPSRPSVNKLLLELVKGEYLDRRENVLLVGPSWTGKTHLATALGMAACAQGKKVRFFRVTELITFLLEAKEERQLLRMRAQLGNLDLLILDELAYIPTSNAGAELLFDVIATAYERNCDSPGVSDAGGNRIMVSHGGPNDGRFTVSKTKAKAVLQRRVQARCDPPARGPAADRGTD